MATYTVLVDWTDDEGAHKPGDTIKLDAGDAREQVEIDRLVSYGVVAPAPAPQKDSSKNTTQPADAKTAPAKQD
jgi:hypothetical protein